MWICSGTPVKTCFCTSSKITIFYKICNFCVFCDLSFYQDFFSRTLIIYMTAGEGRGRFLSNYSDIYLLLCIWNGYLRFLITSQVITKRVLPHLGISIWLIGNGILISVYLRIEFQTHKWWIWACFTLTIQAKRLAKCSYSPPDFFPKTFCNIYLFFWSLPIF